MTGSYLGSLQDLHHRQTDRLDYQTSESDGFWTMAYSERLLGSGSPCQLQGAGAGRNSEAAPLYTFTNDARLPEYLNT